MEYNLTSKIVRSKVAVTPKSGVCQAAGFSERLASLIEDSGLSRLRFAARIGVGTSCLAKWLNGKLLPKSMQLLALAKATGKTMEWCLTGETESDREMIDRIRIDLQHTWKELAISLNLSESMLYQVLSGKRCLSKRARHRLNELEARHLKPGKLKP